MGKSVREAILTLFAFGDATLTAAKANGGVEMGIDTLHVAGVPWPRRFDTDVRASLDRAIQRHSEIAAHVDVNARIPRHRTPKTERPV